MQEGTTVIFGRKKLTTQTRLSWMVHFKPHTKKEHSPGDTCLACKFMLVAKRREKCTSVQSKITLSHPSPPLFFRVWKHYTGQTDIHILTYLNMRHALFIKHYAQNIRPELKVTIHRELRDETKKILPQIHFAWFPRKHWLLRGLIEPSWWTAVRI